MVAVCFYHGALPASASLPYRTGTLAVLEGVHVVGKRPVRNLVVLVFAVAWRANVHWQPFGQHLSNTEHV